jgi:hypothetical protein
MTDAERETLLAEIKWRLDHYGPRDAEPFQFSQYESEAHAALSAVEDWLGSQPTSSGRRTPRLNAPSERRRDSTAFPTACGPPSDARRSPASRRTTCTSTGTG